LDIDEIKWKSCGQENSFTHQKNNKLNKHSPVALPKIITISKQRGSLLISTFNKHINHVMKMINPRQMNKFHKLENDNGYQIYNRNCILFHRWITMKILIN